MHLGQLAPWQYIDTCPGGQRGLLEDTVAGQTLKEGETVRHTGRGGRGAAGPLSAASRVGWGPAQWPRAVIRMSLILQILERGVKVSERCLCPSAAEWRVGGTGTGRRGSSAPVEAGDQRESRVSSASRIKNVQQESETHQFCDQQPLSKQEKMLMG